MKLDLQALVLALFVALASMACATRANGSDEDVETGKVSQAIINGDIDEDDPAVVALLKNGSVFCSGVLVTPSIVVTAAHCVDPSPPDEVFFGTKPGTKSGTYIKVAHARAHDDFDPDTLVNDIAVVALAKRASVKPATVSTDFEKSMVGKPIRLIGFGVTSADATTGLKKRVGETTVASMTGDDFRFKPNPAQTCSGDSGGPAFAKNDEGKDVVVGIASSGDADCKQYGRHIRIDQYLDFIDDNATTYSLKVGQGEPIDSADGCTMSRRKHPTSSITALFGVVLAMGAAIKRRAHRKMC